MKRKGIGIWNVKWFLMLAMVFLFCFRFNPVLTVRAEGAAQLNKTSVTLFIGGRVKLELKNAPDTVVWTSSNPAIATVGKTGIVTGKKTGEVTITAACNGENYRCKITVDNPSITAKNLLLCKDQEKTVTLKGTKRAAKWTSSNEEVVRVKSRGTSASVTGRKKGTAIITASIGGREFTCRIKVEEPVLSDENLVLTEGETKRITLSGTSQPYTWESSWSPVASVSETGVITAKEGGYAKISAKIGSWRISCKVKVNAIRLSSSKLQIVEGKSKVLSLVGNKKKVWWSSNKNSVASVDSNGVVTGKKPGTARITATAGGKKYTCQVTVTKKLTGVAAKYHKLYLEMKNCGALMENGYFAFYGTFPGSNGEDIEAQIAYNPENKRFVYKTVSYRNETGFNVRVETRMIYSGNDFKKCIAQVDCQFPWYIPGLIGSGRLDYVRTYFDAASYTPKRNQKFYLVKHEDGPEPYISMDLQAIGNESLEYSFRCWSELLKAKTGMSMKELGFTAYK